jgi:hypothetical protein
MPFALDSSPELSEVSEAINYLLANFGANMAADPVTGQVTGPTGIVIAYLYKYLSVKYSDSSDGSVNFSNTPTNRLYYGLRNSNDSTESTNPADYIWYKVVGGFGTTKFLFYQTTGGRQVGIAIDTTNPSSNYVQDAGTAIDLDLLTAGKGRQVAYPTIYQWTATITPPSRPTTTTTFTWSTGAYTAPSGWTTTPTTDTTPGHYLWAITVPLSASPNDLTSVCDWTNTSYAIYNLAYNGANGANGSNGSNGLNFLNAYLVQDQSYSPPSFTTTTSGATIPSGWTGTAPSVAVGQVLWYIQGQYNSSSVTINGIAANTTYWTGPIAASIFQDIRSDNWNGSNPPTASNVGTWGTTGYYISRTDGNMYANGFYARGVMKVNGAVYNPGLGYTTAIDVNASAGSSIGVIGYSNVSTGFGVVGWTQNASASVGVNGTSTVIGSTGVLANNTANGIALDVAGKMQISNNTLVTNLNADLLDGQHAAAFVNIASGATNGDYLYYLNNNTTPSNQTTRAAWIKVATNTGGYVWFPGYL